MPPTLRPTSLRHLFSAYHATPSSSLPSSTSRKPTQTNQQLRALHARVTQAPVPEPTPFVPDTQTFLTLIGRSLATHASKIPSWAALFSLSSQQLRDLGVEPARARRYLLRWRAKFRRGEWGVGGDCAHVDAEGRAELRVVEVPDESVSAEGQGRGGATLSTSAGMKRIVVNVPVDAAVRAAPVEAAEGEEGAAAESQGRAFRPLSAEELARSRPITTGVKHRGTKGLVGSHIEPIKGTSGQAAIIRVKEGLWEDVRGHKIDGGERRQAEVRAKRRAAERKAGVR